MRTSGKFLKRCLVSSFSVYIILFFICAIVIERNYFKKERIIFRQLGREVFDHLKDSIFQGFDNVNGTANGSYIVPNYVHFLFFGSPRILYAHAVCVLAAYKNQKPEKVFFHTNIEEFTGPHWEKIRVTLGSVLHIVNATLPNEIFGQNLSVPFHIWHAGDITRIRILMEYGGIFLDNDSYLVKSLDPFRRYEMTIGVTDDNYMGTMVLIGHKDARFLKLWLESYRDDYNPDSWYYNAGQKPMRSIIEVKPELVHKVNTLLGVHGLTDRLYIWNKWDNWRKFYSIHLMIRHRNYLDTLWNNLRWRYIDETNICYYPKPFGEMAREIYSDFCPKNLELSS